MKALISVFALLSFLAGNMFPIEASAQATGATTMAPRRPRPWPRRPAPDEKVNLRNLTMHTKNKKHKGHQIFSSVKKKHHKAVPERLAINYRSGPEMVRSSRRLPAANRPASATIVRADVRSLSRLSYRRSKRRHDAGKGPRGSGSRRKPLVRAVCAARRRAGCRRSPSEDHRARDRSRASALRRSAPAHWSACCPNSPSAAGCRARESSAPIPTG